jgi:hypothetical protein
VIVKINEKGGECSMCGERKSAYGVLVRRPEGKAPLGRPMHRWEDNIKRTGTGPIGLAEDKDRWCSVTNAVMNLRVP